MQKEKNKIKNVWSLLARSSSVDREKNSLSIFEIIEEVSITSFSKNKKGIKQKSVSIEFQIISFWVRDNFDGLIKEDVDITFFDPKNKKLASFRYIVEIPKNKKRLRTITNVKNLPFSESGEYIFELSSQQSGKKEVLTNIPLEIIIKV